MNKYSYEKIIELKTGVLHVLKQSKSNFNHLILE